MNNRLYRVQLITRVYTFSLLIVRFLKDVSKKDFVFEIMAKQLIRSATSIGANIVEAQGSPSDKDFKNFLHHALKSANETRYWLGLIRDTDAPHKKQASALLKEAQEISKILGSTVQSLKKKQLKTPKG